MTTKCIVVVAFVFSVLLLAACDAPPDTASKASPSPVTTAPNNASKDMTKPDIAAIAQKVVAQNAGIKEGDIVQISGEIKDAELLEEIALEVRKQGAFPLLQMYRENQERAQRALKEVPTKWDGQTNQLALKLAGMVTANITVANGEANNLTEDMPQERLEAQRKANEPIAELTRKRNVKNVILGGNGLYPNKRNAERLGIPQADLAKIFWNGINTDYTQLQTTGEQYRQMLAAGKEVQITHPNGTDFKVRIEKRPVFVSDGVISAEDVKRGGAAVTVWLPAGEVYVTTVPNTAEGKIVVERENYIGAKGDTVIEGLTLEFKAGKLVAMNARSGLEPLKRAYDKVTGPAAEGKDQFAFIDLGVNRSVVLGPQAKRGDYAPAGMISVGFGGNVVYGGENKAAWGYETNLSGCTVKLDGKVLVENGSLK